MNIGDLIEELQKFPVLSTVFMQCDRDEDSLLHQIDSTHEVWVKPANEHTSILSGPYVEVKPGEAKPDDVIDHGVMIYG